ncbi:hypothetical protein HN784_03920 [bacterium]|jgi:hypothetical protein|nr:hypothetical protein [Candidatus Woesearchaeota archaeon]MBT6217883.1 hypothetical protein [Candidatus Neomarinimicrobiota bacterium]MBT7139977.1 hypothetical protein [Gammaproteobacteria bacterium]MBT7431964.1 hypothetical protein [bacterium]
MSNIEVYDKVSWHFPEGQNCTSLEVAKVHFVALMEWLKINNLLSDEGKEVLELGFNSDFSITSSMLDSKGNEVLKKHYSDLIRSIDYTNKPNLTPLNDWLEITKNS